MTVQTLDTPAQNTYYPIDHLAILAVSGDDAGTFLQGQLTCNIQALTATQASLAAFCNAKGRVISTLLVIKAEQRYLVILPTSLVEKVQKKLQMYVLRSKVHIARCTELTLTGLACPLPMSLALPERDFHCHPCGPEGLTLKLPSSTPRFLCLLPLLAKENAWLQDFAQGNGSDWRFQDISSGMPWFELEQSENHIPQTLNIDQLGGISFNKGCYTGQEIVARTHYLGKSKRQLYLGECAGALDLAGDVVVQDATTQEKIGEILTCQAAAGVSRLLIVLQTVEGATKNLILSDESQTPVTLISFQ